MAQSSAQVLKAFGRTVRKRRLALGWSQERLAEEAELDRTYVGSIERGERNVSLINIVVLARALGSAPGALFDSLR